MIRGLFKLVIGDDVVICSLFVELWVIVGRRLGVVRWGLEGGESSEVRGKLGEVWVCGWWVWCVGMRFLCLDRCVFVFSVCFLFVGFVGLVLF